MSKARIEIKTDQEIKDKAKRDSKAHFGFENVNAYIVHLIKNNNPK